MGGMPVATGESRVVIEQVLEQIVRDGQALQRRQLRVVAAQMSGDRLDEVEVGSTAHEPQQTDLGQK